MKKLYIAVFLSLFLASTCTQTFISKQQKKEPNSITIRIDGKEYHSQIHRRCGSDAPNGEWRCQRVHVINLPEGDRCVATLLQLQKRQLSLLEKHVGELAQKLEKDLWFFKKTRKLNYQREYDTAKANLLACKEDVKFNYAALKKFKKPLREKI